MIRKTVIPAAGLGTRLLPATKEIPKEMLPIFLKTKGICPMLQAVFEQLYDVGFREFCFVVGRGKRAIEDHFTADLSFVNILRKKNEKKAEDLLKFYNKVDSSTMLFVNQPEPRGFGDAVLRAKSFIAEDFLVHAGDTYILSPDNNYLKRLISLHDRLQADVTFIIQEVEDPRQYGVAKMKNLGEDLYRVEEVVEKPEKPESNWAMMPVYIFNPTIFKALEKTPPGKGGEIQLTDGIQKLIEWGLKVIAVKLRLEDIRLDIGTPETFWKALEESYRYHTH